MSGAYYVIARRNRVTRSAGESPYRATWRAAMLWRRRASRGRPAPSTPYRDRDVYEAIRAILAATGEFDRVDVGPAANQTGRTSKDDSWAAITPLADDPANDGSTRREFHKATYLLTIGVKRPGRASDVYGSDLDRVVAVVRNALMAPANRSLGGLVLSGFTRLGAGSILVPGQGDTVRNLKGEFAYSIGLATQIYSVAP